MKKIIALLALVFIAAPAWGWTPNYKAFDECVESLETGDWDGALTCYRTYFGEPDGSLRKKLEENETAQKNSYDPDKHWCVEWDEGGNLHKASGEVVRLCGKCLTWVDIAGEYKEPDKKLNTCTVTIQLENAKENKATWTWAVQEEEREHPKPDKRDRLDSFVRGRIHSEGPFGEYKYFISGWIFRHWEKLKEIMEDDK